MKSPRTMEHCRSRKIVDTIASGVNTTRDVADKLGEPLANISSEIGRMKASGVLTKIGTTRRGNNFRVAVYAVAP